MLFHSCKVPISSQIWLNFIGLFFRKGPFKYCIDLGSWVFKTLTKFKLSRGSSKLYFFWKMVQFWVNNVKYIYGLWSNHCSSWRLYETKVPSLMGIRLRPVTATSSILPIHHLEWFVSVFICSTFSWSAFFWSFSEQIIVLVQKTLQVIFKLSKSVFLNFAIHLIFMLELLSKSTVNQTLINVTNYECHHIMVGNDEEWLSFLFRLDRISFLLEYLDVVEHYMPF